MKLRFRIALAVLLALGAVVLVRTLIGDSVVALLSPRGPVAGQERDVIVLSVLVMLGAAVPMLVLLFAFAWRYREGAPRKADDGEKTATPRQELAMWALPAAVVVVLSVIAWTSTHALDPYLRLKGEAAPITVQVIAMRWKWLFIYPEQGIATVNFLEIPDKTPVHLELTADGPVSAFWVPQLGTQIYAMGAMRTQHNLMADEPGDYPGRNMEINGDGYAGMTFTARAASKDDFDAWVRQVKAGPGHLDRASYEVLARPSTDVEPTTYGWADPQLFASVLEKEKMPMPPSREDAMPEMGMH